MKIFNNKKLNKHKLSFSIITPMLNDFRIKKTIDSLTNQTYKNFEHIIIDGGSNRKIINVLKKKSNKVNIIISEKDKGIYDALNKGIKVSNGDIIGILNADDYFYKNTLFIAKKYFEDYNLDYLFGNVMKDRLHHGYWPKKIWWKFNIFPSHSCGFFVRREVHRKLGLYNIKFKYSSDRDFIFKIIKQNLKGMCTNKKHIFGKFNPHGISSKVSYFRNLKEEFLIRANNKQSYFYLIPLFLLTILYKFYVLMINKFLSK